MSSRVDELERLQRLRDSGVLSPEEFEAEKRRILGAAPASAGPPLDAESEETRRSRLWLYVIVGLLGAGVAVAAGIFIGRMVAPQHREPAGSATVNLASNEVEPVLNAAAPAAPDVQTLSPDQQLKLAFQAAYDKPDTVVLALDSGAQGLREDVQFTPGVLLWAPFGPLLVSIGEVKEASHASGGKIAVHYLRPVEDHFEVVRSFVPAVTTGTFGHVDSWSISHKFSTYPVIYTTGGGTWQGLTCTTATLTELTPDGPHDLATIPLSYSNAGTTLEGGTPTNLQGKVRNIVQNQSFDVVYTGSDSFADHYVRTGNVYAVEGGQSRMQTC